MPNTSRNVVRLIGGKLRRRQLFFPEAAGLRPTPNRVRETLFNWLGQDLTGKSCLDLFAGSGALGFEAASRCAKHVVMVEKAKHVYTALQKNRALLDLQQNVELRHQSAIAYLRQNLTQFDIIFLDPPFASDLLATVLPVMIPSLSLQGLVYIEAAQLPSLSSFYWLKQGKAGEVYYGLAQLYPPSAR